MAKASLIILSIIIAGYVLACIALLTLQRKLLYFPQPNHLNRPSAQQQLPVDGAVIELTTKIRPGAQALIYFGGNAEDVSLNLDPFADAFPNHAIYLVHYRGYGHSTGSPSEAALHQDALAIYDHIAQQHPQITLMGRSLGTGVATRLASQRPTQRLILVTPYASIVDIAAQQFRYFPVRWFMQDRFESWRYTPQVTAPTLLIAAGRDEIIPMSSTEQLQKSFPTGISTLQVINKADHNSVQMFPEYWQMLEN